MADTKKIINAHMRTIVDCFGCHDAVASTLYAALDVNYTKSMISRKLSGRDWHWGCAEIIVLENAIDKYPVTKFLAQRLSNSSDKEIADCLVDQSGAISKEVGEAVHSILKAQQSNSSDDSAKAIAEIREAIDALQAAENRLTGVRPGEIVQVVRK